MLVHQIHTLEILELFLGKMERRDLRSSQTTKIFRDSCMISIEYFSRLPGRSAAMTL